MLQNVYSSVLIAQEVERDESAIAVLWLHPHVVDIFQYPHYIRTVGKHLLVAHVFQLPYLAHDAALVVDTVEIVDNLRADGY